MEMTLLEELARSNAAVFVPGRQATGYRKLAVLLSGRHSNGSSAEAAALRDERLAALIDRSLALLEVPRASAFWDAWLLHYPRGAMIPGHKDAPDAAGVGHHRLNALVTPATRGGVLVIDGDEVALFPGDGVLFRPDLQVHAVSEVVVGERLVWSVGCWKAAEAHEDADPGVE